MREDIFNYLNGDNSGMALMLLHKPEIKLSKYEKILLSNHFIKKGSPKELEDKLLKVLGEECLLYLNPFLHKLLTANIPNIVEYLPMEYESLKGESYKQLLMMVFDKKLKEYQSIKSPHGYRSKKTLEIDTEERKLLQYKLESFSGKSEVLKLDLDARGYIYNIRVFMMDTGKDLSAELTERSIKAIKGQMYFMSENDTWQIESIDECMKYVEFKNPLLNALTRALINLYDKKPDIVEVDEDELPDITD